VSLAIHRVTGGCRSVDNKETAVRISPEIFSRCEADVFSLAEGSIGSDRYCEVVPTRRGP
jgi:hypothetical protein